VGDTVNEPTERFLINLTGPTNATVSGTAGTGTGTIVNDDAEEVPNRNPVAADDDVKTNEDKSVVIKVLKNDSDPDGDKLSLASVTQAQFGTVEIVGKNVKYRPNENFFGTDMFTYTIQDGKGGTATATVNVIVFAVNDKPTAEGESYTVAEDAVLSVSAANGVLANDADVDGDVLHPDLIAGPKHGTLELNEDGSFLYTPDADFHGQDFFVYNACDGELDSRPVKVLITVTSVNDAPVLQEIADRTVEEGTQLKFKVKATDVDRPKDTLTFSLGDGAPAGASINAQTGEFKWTPTAQQGPGVYQITVRVSDGEATDSKTFVVTVTERLIKETLIIRGTTGCDVIKICEEDGGLLKVDVNGNTKSYRLACGVDIKVLGLDGEDIIILKGLNRDALVDGGNGHDLIDGRGVRNGKLTLKGGNGCDLLLGGCGDDVLEGGNGNDILIGGGGCDTLRGGTGCDVLFQGTARDAWNAYQQYGTSTKAEQLIQWWQNKSTKSQRAWVRDFVAGLRS
jgi:VCBS repeat-containing protein